MDFLKRRLCSVYLILEEEAFSCGKLQIEAYFTLSHKSLIPDFEKVSRSKIQTVDGFKDAQSIHFVLIGQLGKYLEQTETGAISSSNITSKEILDFAFEIIGASSALIPCRCALVECSFNPKVHKVYTAYGFRFFQNDGEHHQFYKRI